MPDRRDTKLGKFVRQHREAKGLSMRAVAKAMGVDHTTVMYIESGRFEAPAPDKLVRLARVLEVAVEDLFALAGYLMPEGLPGLQPYLRVKEGLTKTEAAAVEQFVRELKEGAPRRKAEKGGGRGKPGR